MAVSSANDGVELTNVTENVFLSGYISGIFKSFHHIRWVVKAGRRIKLIVGIAKTKLPEEMSRGSIIGIVTGEKAVHLKGAEGIAYNCDGGLAGITSPPLV